MSPQTHFIHRGALIGAVLVGIRQLGRSDISQLSLFLLILREATGTVVARGGTRRPYPSKAHRRGQRSLRPENPEAVGFAVPDPALAVTLAPRPGHGLDPLTMARFMRVPIAAEAPAAGCLPTLRVIRDNVSALRARGPRPGLAYGWALPDFGMQTFTDRVEGACDAHKRGLFIVGLGLGTPETTPRQLFLILAGLLFPAAPSPRPPKAARDTSGPRPRQQRRLSRAAGPLRRRVGQWARCARPAGRARYGWCTGR